MSPTGLLIIIQLAPHRPMKAETSPLKRSMPDRTAPFLISNPEDGNGSLVDHGTRMRLQRSTASGLSSLWMGASDVILVTLNPVWLDETPHCLQSSHAFVIMPCQI
ncbi:hypothetical protein M758_3G110700 [Ceratodon purpureus]|nr:hypothetical protein M758_3G110700 [Ceratodon purpureus]